VRETCPTEKFHRNWVADKQMTDCHLPYLK
jgi:hypothetical protein